MEGWRRHFVGPSPQGLRITAKRRRMEKKVRFDKGCVFAGAGGRRREGKYPSRSDVAQPRKTQAE